MKSKPTKAKSPRKAIPKKTVSKKKVPAIALKKSLLHFSLSQQNAIRQGTEVRRRLLKVVEEACDNSNQNTYLYSMPGFGKTHTVEKTLEKKGIPFETVSGNTSMFGFCLRLAVIDDIMEPDDRIVIVVDDCDEILKNEGNINIVKSILEGQRILRYEKSMAALKSGLSDVQNQAIDNHANPNAMGFQVDCSKMQFIFTSNKKLPTLKDIAKKSTAINNHLHAIRSRCFTEDFDHSWEIMWGWLVDIVLSHDVEHVKKLSDEQKLILLDWMYNNWNALKEASIRTCSKMAHTMLGSPKDFRTSWELSYLNR